MKPYAVAYVLLISVAIFLEGCAWSPTKKSWPLPPQELVEYDPAITSPKGSYRKISIAQAHAQGLLDIITKHSRERGQLDWATGDYTSLGVIAAVGGAMADQTGLMNTGIGMSALGITAADRYQYNIQFAAYDGALKAMDCLVEAIGRTNDDEVLWGAIQTKSTNIRLAASKLPTVAVKATTRVKRGLIDRLGKIQNEPVSTADLHKVLEAQRKAAEDLRSVGQTVPGKVSTEQADLLKYDTPALMGRALGAADHAEKKRIENEESLVPLALQTEVGERLVTLPADIEACVAGY